MTNLLSPFFGCLCNGNIAFEILSSCDHSYLCHVFPLNKSLSKVNIYEERFSQAEQQPEALETSNH